MLLRLLFFICVSSILSAYELSVVAIFRDEAKYLKEWIDYHRLVGVEHFWLYNDGSADNWESVLSEYVDAGVVDVIKWADSSAVYGYYRQSAAYIDCIQKVQEKTKWLAIIDIDEFIVPMKEETIVQCLNKRYLEAGAVYMNWRNFGTGKVTIPEGESVLYHLTACSLTGHPNNSAGKSIVRPELVITETLWSPHFCDLKAGARYFNGNAVMMPFRGEKFEPDSKHCDKFLRVNHYPHRDEYFFWNFRYKRMGDKELLLEHYESFSKIKDTAIWRFVRKLYPDYFSKHS